jgi:tetratricopeptide (TPR) repeat protein
MRATSLLAGRLILVAVVVGCFLVNPGAAAPILKDEEQQLREKALKLNDITGDEPIQGQILTFIEDKPGTKKLLAAAYKLAKDKGKEQPFNVNATYILARTAQALKPPEVDISEYFYRQHAAQALKLESSQKVARAYNGLISLFYENKRFADSEKVCKEFLELPGDAEMSRFKFLAMRSMVLTQAKQGKIDEALKLVENLIRLNPENWLTRQLKGHVLREAGKYDEAVKIYEDVLDRINKDERLDKEQKDDFGGEIRYTLSGVYVDLNKIDKAADQLKTLISKDEKNPTYHNDLGFIWADHDMNLDEAEKHIRVAIEEEKKLRKKANTPAADDHDNSAYLDSLGWVLFKKKKFKEALDPLVEAVKYDEGQHLEIYDHLADVYMALEQKDKAIETWKKGLGCPPVSKRDEARKLEVEKKLKKLEGK